MQIEQVGAKVLLHGVLDPARKGERDKDVQKANKIPFQEPANIRLPVDPHDYLLVPCRT